MAVSNVHIGYVYIYLYVILYMIIRVYIYMSKSPKDAYPNATDGLFHVQPRTESA